MYPVFLHLKQVPCLVVGAGAVAQRRIFSLLEQEADVTVLAPEPIPLPLQHQSLRYIQAVYATSFLKDMMGLQPIFLYQLIQRLGT